MKIKRTVANSVREAMNKVRQEQGPDAVILANRKIKGGVEIISATDYDENALDTLADAEPTPVEKKAPPAKQRPVAKTAPPVLEFETDDEDPPTSLSYQSIARANEQAAREATPRALPDRDPEPPPRRKAPKKQVAAEITPVPSEPVTIKTPPPQIQAQAPTPSPSTQQVAQRPEVKPNAGPERQHFADITATPEHQRRSGFGGYEADSTSWQQGQLIHDLQRELHSLRGLMQNQLSVLEWDALARRNPVQFDLLSRLSDMGVGADVARELVNTVDKGADPDKIWRLALGRLANQIPIANDDLLDNGGIVALVGPTGVGKTTSVAKIAARFVMRHGQRSVGLISTDGYRIGAHDQLQHYARILGVQCKTANNQDELSQALGSFFDKKLVLIDTAGMSQRDIRLGEQITTLRESFPLIRTYLVMAASTQLGALDESAKGFGRADLSGSIVTKLDETTSVGAAITVAIRHQLPIAYVGVGQRVPEDLQPARAHRLVSRAVPMADKYGEEIDPDTLAIRFGRGVAHAHG